MIKLKDSDYSREKLYKGRYRYTCNHCGFEFGSTSGIGERNMREHLGNCAKRPVGDRDKWEKIRREADNLKTEG